MGFIHTHGLLNLLPRSSGPVSCLLCPTHTVGCPHCPHAGRLITVSLPISLISIILVCTAHKYRCPSAIHTHGYVLPIFTIVCLCVPLQAIIQQSTSCLIRSYYVRTLWSWATLLVSSVLSYTSHTSLYQAHTYSHVLPS